MSILILMSNSIINANNIYIALKDNIREFEKEAVIISEAKCYLINNKELNNFVIEGVDVNVHYEEPYYYLTYEDTCLRLEIEKGIILDYSTY